MLDLSAASIDIPELSKAATAAMKAKEWETAAKVWLQCLDLQLAQPCATHQAQLVACYLASNRLNAARELLDKALLAHPFDFDLTIQSAELAHLENNDHTAIQSWCICLALNAKKMPHSGFKKLSGALRRAGHLEYARAIIAQGLQRFPNAPLLLTEWAQTEADDNQLQIAAELWLQAIKHYRGVVPVGIYLPCCQSLIKTSQHEKCVEILESALKNHPGDFRINNKIKEVKILCRVDTLTLAEKIGSYRFTYYKQKNNSEIIIFTFGTIRTDFSSPAFGFPFLIAEGFDHVHVAQGLSQQYQELSLEDFATIAKPVCQGKRAYTYGSSLGGYAAIYFGSIIQACAIASSPTLPAHDMAKRFPKNKINIQHIPIEKFKSDYRVYVFFDPNDVEDSKFLEERLVPACADLIKIPLPFSGHQSLRILGEVGLLKETIRRIILDFPDLLQFEEDVFKNTFIYLEEYALYLERNGQYQQAIDIGCQCIAQKPRVRAFNVVIRCALKLGQFEFAIRQHGEAIAKFPVGNFVKLPLSARVGINQVNDSAQLPNPC